MFLTLFFPLIFTRMKVHRSVISLDRKKSQHVSRPDHGHRQREAHLGSRCTDRDGGAARRVREDR